MKIITLLFSVIIILSIYHPLISMTNQKHTNSTQDLFPAYITVTDNNSFPKPFMKLDSLLDEVLSPQYFDYVSKWKYQLRVNSISNEMLNEFAKVFVSISYIPHEIKYNFFKIANKPSKAQSKREHESRENKQKFEEVKIPLPGHVYRKIKDEIFKKLPWQWKFHIENKYIIEVKPKKYNRLYIGKNKGSKADYYLCDVISDLNGNFKGPNPVLLGVNFVKGKMEIGKTYVVLLWGRNPITEYHGEHYIVRGPSTDTVAFFPVNDGLIIDEDGKLRLSSHSMSVSAYRQEIAEFFSNIEEVNNE